MKIWIDIEDQQGRRQGDGPITSAAGWTLTPRLDRAGAFSFRMPASDARRRLIRVKRIARCWGTEGAENSRLREYGAGVIDAIRTVAGEDGVEMLEVSGDDLLRELTYRNVGDLALVDRTPEHPAYLSYLVSGVSESYLSNCYDLQVGDTTTWHSVTLNNDVRKYIYVGDPRGFDTIRFVLGTAKNGTTVKTLAAQYYNAESGGWDLLTIVDGTAVAGRTLAQSGDITFDTPGGWGLPAGWVHYPVRLYLEDGSIPAVDIADIAVLRDAPTGTALAQVMALAPPGWELDTLNGHAATAGAEAIGDELLANGGWELYAGTPDDGVTDSIEDWTASWVNDALGNHVEVTADALDGAVGLKLTNGGLVEGANPMADQVLTLPPKSDYELRFWTHGDGTREGAYRLLSLKTPVYLQSWVTPPVDTGITGATWTEFRHRFTTPEEGDELKLFLYAPWYLYPGSAYFDRVSLRAYRRPGVYMRMSGETALEALTRIAEQTGEHFITGYAGRRVLWLGTDRPRLGLRAVYGADPIAIEGNTDACVILSLEEAAEGYDLCSRVYATGGGTGSARVSLRDTSRLAPAGYTLDRTGGWLERDAAVTALGRIDKVLTLSELNASDASETQRTEAANAVFDRALTYLERHSATDTDPLSATCDLPRIYNLRLAKCERAIYPGHLLRATYRRYVDDVVVMNVDGELVVLESTIEIGESGIRTVACQCSTVDAQPDDDAMAMALEIQRLKVMVAHSPAEAGLNSSRNGVVVSQGVRDGRVTNVRRIGGAESGEYERVIVREGVVIGGTLVS